MSGVKPHMFIEAAALPFRVRSWLFIPIPVMVPLLSLILWCSSTVVR